VILKKKLIEVALPLEAINQASAKEKSIRHGHPSTLHLWWARRPLAAARAVTFAQMVDDPSAYVDLLRADSKLRRKAESVLKGRLKLWEDARVLSEKAAGSGLHVPEPGPAPTLDDVLADEERQRLFRIIEDLVLWENTTRESVLRAARDEIWQTWRRACAENADHPEAKNLFDRNKLPPFQDPFAGGGALPLEAQRLGLESHASDLNPVAVLINKAMIEIPPKFADRRPVNRDARGEIARSGGWHGKGAEGLAIDVRYYCKWMRDEAEKRIGHLYPKVEVTRELANSRSDLKPLVGKKLTVIAWLWARTVKSPNPAFADVHVPLTSSFMLSGKPGHEVYVEPRVGERGYEFTVKMGTPPDPETVQHGTKLARGANFRCVMSGAPISQTYIREEFLAKRSGSRLMAFVAESEEGRVYFSPTSEMEAAAARAKPAWKPEQEMNQESKDLLSGRGYGFTHWFELFTPRQLVALTTFSDLVLEARELAAREAQPDYPQDTRRLHEGGCGANAYGDAIAVYLAFCLDKASLTNTTQATWQKDPDRLTQGFGRQAIPMIWDYAEANPLSDAGGGFAITGHAVAKVLERLPLESVPGSAEQRDAGSGPSTARRWIISTDPPYYDNISYADLSDYFYIWLRHSLKSTLPELFTTLAVPKAEELVATAYRHGGRVQAETFFMNGMTRVMHSLAEQAHPAFPVTIYYAFKQAETESSGTASTGWETFLDAVIQAGFGISGTWPVRTELTGNLKKNVGALASSIILVCRARDDQASTATRREFVAALKAELPKALADLQRGNIAPVDLAQAAIGPGMAIYTRYAGVLDADGKRLLVREALALINQTLDEALAEQEGDFDPDTRWALAWFEQSGFAEGEYGVAETLSKAKNTSVAGMVDAGLLKAGRGKVRLLKPGELDQSWAPTSDERLTAWEVVHHLIDRLETRGERATADLVAELGAKAEIARELAYRLYTICERKKRAAEALSYNALVQSWPEIVRLAHETQPASQAGLFGRE